MSKKKNNTPQEIKKTIEQSEKILVVMDSRFDYDALCSTITMDLVLREYFNKSATLVFAGVIPQRAKAFIEYPQISQETDPATMDLYKFNLIISLDSAEDGRYSKKSSFRYPKGSTVLNIDHHESNDYFGTLNYVNHVGSNCTNMYMLFEQLNLPLTKQLGDILVLGLLTDTGFFNHNSVTSKDHEFASKLLELGVNIYSSIWKFTFNETLDNLKMKEMIISNLNINYEKRYAYSYYTQDDVVERGIEMSNAYQPEADVIKRLTGVDLVFVLKESTDRDVSHKLSFRSHNFNFDVNELASKFGGAGHSMAAGAPLDGFDNIKDALDATLEKLDSLL